MERYQIEDLVEQDAGSILYRATDKETGRKVAIRRICGGDELSFIQKGEEEKSAFLEKLNLLKEAEGSGFRQLYDGGVDEVDHAPWLVYEWIDSRSFTHEPVFEGSDKELRHRAMRAVLNCLVVLHDAGQLIGWLGFENLFLNDEGKWIIELRPERMAIAHRGGIEVEHLFASSRLKNGERGDITSDLRGLRPLFAMLIKGTADAENRVVLPSEWMRYLGWLKRREEISAREALERLEQIKSHDVLDAVSEIRKKNRASTQPITAREETTQLLSQGGSMGTRTTSLQDNSPPQNQGAIYTPTKKSKLPLLLGLIVGACILVLFFMAAQKAGQGPSRATPVENSP